MSPYCARASLPITSFLTIAALIDYGLGQPCTGRTAQSGIGTRWPVANPSLVAPVKVNYFSQPYNHPLIAEFTGTAVSVEIPPDFSSGFNLTNPKTKKSELYSLRSIELRKPGHVPDGVQQVLSHSFEAVLIHKETTGSGDWASVIVPFQVGMDANADFISTMLAGSRLPTTRGQREPLLVAGLHNLNLNPVWEGAVFHHFWTMLPTECDGQTLPARQLMRASSMTMPLGIAHSLQEVLKWVPETPPASPPQVTWLLKACPSSAQGNGCADIKPEDLTARLKSAQEAQSASVIQLRNDKAHLDAVLAQLENKSTAEMVNMALDARDNLRAAVGGLTGAKESVKLLNTWTTQGKTAKWDSDKPAAVPVPVANAGNKSGVNNIPKPVPVANPGNKSGVKNATLLATSFVMQEGLKLEDCSALRQSPVDIDEGSAVAAAVREPLLFRMKTVQPTASPQQKLRIFNRADHLRIEAALSQSTNIQDWPLGAVLSEGRSHPVAHVDLHVPGEHAVDGLESAAELQLIAPREGAPALAVAVPLRLDNTENKWLASLVESLPRPGKEAAMEPGPWPQVHVALGEGSATNYFRYEGSTTRPPCGAADWFVLEEPGHVAKEQLLALMRVLPAAAVSGEAAARRHRFKPALVVEGSPSLAQAAAAMKRKSSFLVAPPGRELGVR
eukprot:CAMPEP_0172673800 /NCGR_PEP_ID=MMETSP1074-20121228/12370_1 /TAXON_ID=2916 /ORGANISM="Ceratium fusus, Strain PA161109" /LENGTH=672 /DNA_ID=CAMNT_0013491157 /DNA_START=33 /DNA_END=2051 /DNA_ORIENTATION=+